MRNKYVKFLLRSPEFYIYILFLVSVILLYFPSYDVVRKYNNKAANMVRLETGRYAVGWHAEFHLFSVMAGCRLKEAAVRVIYFKKEESSPSTKNICIVIE